jgi:hypothetical protein
MSEKWSGDYLAVAVERYNAMAAGLAAAAPLVAAALDGARNTGDRVDKRTRAKVRAIMAEHMPADRWACWRLNTEYTYTVYLDADFNSPVNDNYAVAYGKLSVAVARLADGGATWVNAYEGSGYPARDVADVVAGLAAVRAARAALDAAQSALYAATVAAGPFLPEWGV